MITTEELERLKGLAAWLSHDDPTEQCSVHVLRAQAWANDLRTLLSTAEQAIRLEEELSSWRATAGTEAGAHRELQEENRRLREALTPSGATKCAYIGEIKDPVHTYDADGEEHWIKHTISWDATKATMKMIAARAALGGADD